MFMEDEKKENEAEGEKVISSGLKKRVITGAILVFSLGTFCYLATFYYWARIILLIIAFLVSILSLFEFYFNFDFS